MSEWSAHTPSPHTRLIDGPEMKNLFKSLEELGWVEVVPDDLASMVVDRRMARYISGEGASILMEIRDQINGLHLRILQEGPGTDRMLIESDWISVNRLIALLDVMGIRRADDGWVSWWRASVWG